MINLIVKMMFSRNRYSKVIVVNEDNLKRLKRNTILIIKKDFEYEWIKFKCPCGCNNDIILPLSNKKVPNWKLSIDTQNKVTLFPSVNAIGFKCKAHFWISKNRVKWVSCDRDVACL